MEVRKCGVYLQGGPEEGSGELWRRGRSWSTSLEGHHGACAEQRGDKAQFHHQKSFLALLWATQGSVGVTNSGGI